MLLLDFSPGTVPIKQQNVERVSTGQLMEQVKNVELDLLEVGSALVPELKKAREKGLPVAVGVPEEGNILRFLGIIQVIYGILGSFPFVVPVQDGVYDLDQALDLYELMDSARLMRI